MLFNIQRWFLFAPPDIIKSPRRCKLKTVLQICSISMPNHLPAISIRSATGLKILRTYRITGYTNGAVNLPTSWPTSGTKADTDTITTYANTNPNSTRESIPRHCLVRVKQVGSCSLAFFLFAVGFPPLSKHLHMSSSDIPHERPSHIRLCSSASISFILVMFARTLSLVLVLVGRSVESVATSDFLIQAAGSNRWDFIPLHFLSNSYGTTRMKRSEHPRVHPHP